MNDKFINSTEPDNEKLARTLSRAAEQTQVNGQFAADLEEKLRSAHRPKGGWLATFYQVSPTLRWVALMVLLAIVLSWSIKTLIPAPQPAIQNTPTGPSLSTPTPAAPAQPTGTPSTLQGGYDWRGTKLYLGASLPAGPEQASLYILKDEPPLTEDTVRALGEQFGVQGQIYTVQGRGPGLTGFLLTDGRQRLYVQSNLEYAYYADYAAYSYMSGAKTIPDEQAAGIIDAFMKSHGLDFVYRFDNPRINPGMYYILPLSPDGMPVYHDHNMPERIEFTIDDNGQVILVASYQVEYEAAGSYAIRTADEAFQEVLAQSTTIQNGVLEIMRSAGMSNSSFWSRSYPDNQTITIYGQPANYASTVPGTPPFLSIGQYTVTGNVGGLEDVDSSTYVEATGQFITENGIRTFQVDSWAVTSAPEVYYSGSLHRDGDQTVLSADDGSGDYVVIDAPDNVPLDTKIGEDYLAVHGFLKDGQIDWDTINYYPSGSGGGGGGGGGNGFYKLNLSGTPVPFPTPTAQPGSSSEPTEYVVQEGDTLGSIGASFGVSVADLIRANGLPENGLIQVGQKLLIPPPHSTLVGQHLDGLRGLFMMTTYRQADGGQRIEYGFYLKPNDGPFFFAKLEGDNLEGMQAYHNRLVDIWGTVDRMDPNGFPILKVERYEIPFPEVQFQLLHGTQKMSEVDGQEVTLFTSTDGTTYAQLTSVGEPDGSINSLDGSEVILEVLPVPGETFGGYPALRVFSSTLAVNPKTNQPEEATITADQPYVAEETPVVESSAPPALTIETVELVYYVPDPRYGDNASTPGPHYIQPAWRFYGHYSDGSEIEFLVQALKQEFLLPELAPYRPPG